MVLTVAPAANGSLAAAAYETIRRAILRCELAPGDQVSESRLASQYGLGRAAVRAALTRLSHERLVEAIPRRGYAVAPVTLQQINDLFGVRLVVEPAAARLAAGRVNERMLADLDRLNAACVDSGAHDNAEELRQANKAFHVGLAGHSGNARLEQMVSVAFDELDRVLYLPQVANVWDRIGASFDEHQRIIDAVRQRDGDTAEHVTREHILPNRQCVIEGLIASPLLRSINLVSV